MKKLFILLFALILLIYNAKGQISPLRNYRVKNDTTTIKAFLPAGTQIYNDSTGITWILTDTISNRSLDLISDKVKITGELTKVTINGKSGWRLVNAPYNGDIGENAIDLTFTDYSGYGAIGDYSFATGKYSIASGLGSHAEGGGVRDNGTLNKLFKNKATGGASHAEGCRTEATNYYSHAEGYGTKANGKGSHAEGSSTTANGDYSHTEGAGTIADGIGSHAIGYDAHSIGSYSFAGGHKCESIGTYSFAIGNETKSYGFSGFAAGRYAISGGDIGTFNFVASYGNTRTSPVYVDGNKNFVFVSNNTSDTLFIRGTYNALLGGLNNSIDTNIINTAIIGGSSIKAKQSYMVYMPAIRLTKFTIPTVPETGNIVFDGTHFKGYNGSEWKNLDVSPIYSEKYVVNVSGTVSAGQWQTIKGTNGENSGFTITDSTFVVHETGKYLVNLSSSFKHSVDNTDVNIAVFVNDSEQQKLEFQAEARSSNYITGSITGILNLSVDDVVKIKIKAANGGIFTQGYGNINLMLIN